jgi:uncharacterized protein YjbJ (UPF0337 family)
LRLGDYRRFNRFRSRRTAYASPKKDRVMDKDRIAGSAKQIVGSIKEMVGKALGDKKTQDDGKAEQIVGKIQNAVGSAKDTIRNVTETK